MSTKRQDRVEKPEIRIVLVWTLPPKLARHAQVAKVDELSQRVTDKCAQVQVEPVGNAILEEE